MRGLIESKQARMEHNALKNYWSNESRLSQKILITILWQFERQTDLLARLVKQKSAPKRKPTAYMRFFGEKIREGKSAQEIGVLWRQKSKL